MDTNKTLTEIEVALANTSEFNYVSNIVDNMVARMESEPMLF